MAGYARWTIVFLALAVFARFGTALKCWDCSSSNNAMCGDPMNITEHQATFHTKECERSPYLTPKPICRKIVKREHGELIVVRSCSTPNSDEIDIKDGECKSMRTMGGHIIESCHICSTDYCNSATSASATSVLYGSAIALVLAYRRVVTAK